jgi:hypothetical protein
MNVRKTSPYLKQTEPELIAAAEAAGLTIEQGKDILEKFFSYIKLFLSDERMPTIYVPYIGKLHATLGSIRRSFGVSFKLLRSGNLPEKVIKYRIKKYWPIRNRLIKEKLGQQQHRYWRDISSLWYKDGIDLYADVENFYKNEKVEYDKNRGMGGQYNPDRLRIPKTDLEFSKEGKTKIT